MLVPRTLACLALLVTLEWVGACDADDPPPAQSSEQPPAQADPPATPDPPPDPPVEVAEAPPEPEPSEPEPSPPPEPEPIELRRADRSTMLYDAPEFSAAFRGKIARGSTFHVYARARTDDPDCKSGWAKVGTAAYVCLGRSTVVKKPAPRPLPRTVVGGMLPYHYAKRRGPDHPAPVWRSIGALRSGAAPSGELSIEHDYAFMRRRFAKGERVLEDENRRVVKEADVRRFIPSTFEGRDLVDEPLPTEGIMAWVTRWPHGQALEAAHPDADAVAKLEFQSIVVVDDAPVRKRGVTFYPLHDGSGFVEAKAIRRYIPADPLPDAGPDDVWVDIEVSQQTLTLYRGTTPIFATLISSGTGTNPTPLGIYRMESKMALTDMRSKPGDDDSYHVEAVPWAMYFDGRFALHGAYWHNRFGNRVSHGCVNLSPKDAKRVFDTIDPALPNGWITVYEHPQDLGSLVRVRKGTKVPKDRRHEPRRRND